MLIRVSGLAVLAVWLFAAAFLITGCEQTADDPAESTNTTSVVQTNFATANLQGVWNMDIQGGVKDVVGVVVIDTHGNVTGLTGPQGASAAMGSFSVGTDGVEVNGTMKYTDLTSNGISENHTMYFQGHFENMNKMSGQDTHSWLPASNGGYDTGTFTLSK